MTEIPLEPIPENAETKPLNPELLAFVQEHKERLYKIAEEHAWLNEHLTPLLRKDGLDSTWSVSISNELWIKKAEGEL